jgi:hypothetical protein
MIEKETSSDLSEWGGITTGLMFAAIFGFMIYIMVQKNKDRRRLKYEKEVSQALNDKLGERTSMRGKR